jgi:hypothetical protein
MQFCGAIFLSMFNIVVSLAVSLPISLLIADPKPGDRFEINSNEPKYHGILFAFGKEQKAWDSYCYGKPLDGGHWVFGEPKHDGAFTLKFENVGQNSGDQSRRILGETIINGKTDIEIKLLALGETREIDWAFEDNYEPVRKTKQYPNGVKSGMSRTPCELEVKVRGVTTRTKCELRIKSGGKTSIKIDGFFTLNGSDIGLRRYPGSIPFRFWFKAFPPKS